MAIVAFLVVLTSVVDRATAADPATPPVPATPDSDDDDPDVIADLLDRRVLLQGPNDVRDILTVENGFLVATGTAIIRYQYFGDMPRAVAVDTADHGLPSGNCYSLCRDANGGAWARCQGGVGYLAPNADRWRAFTSKNGLAPGAVKDVAVSADGKRVWVCSSRGLATTLVDDRKWQTFPADRLINVSVHPTQDIVWCVKGDQYGLSLSQFVLATQAWRDIPDPIDVPDRFTCPSALTVIHGKLWISRGVSPPWLYDLGKNITHGWPKEPNWERMKDRVYRDWFGEMVPSTARKRGPWFATNAGLWRFDEAKDQWQGNIRTKKPGVGHPLLAYANDGKTLYWSSEGTVAAFDTANDQWTDLWQVTPELWSHEQKKSLTLSPDGKTLWLVGLGGVFVGNPTTRKVAMLDDINHPGLTRARFVRFDRSKGLALIATPRGVVCADYEGNLKYSLIRAAPPIDHRVSGFEFAPDGSEVWCLMQNESGFGMPAAVLFPRQDRWELAPDPKDSGRFFCMKFASNGKTVWLSRRLRDEQDGKVVQRRPGEFEWKPLNVQMPEYWPTVEMITESPNGDELWMSTSGSGLFRAKLTTGEVTQYVQNLFTREEGIKYKTLVGDFVHDLVFTANGEIAVCSAGGGGEGGITVIDLPTGAATNYETEHDWINKLVISPDNRTVWCVVPDKALLGFDLQTKTWSHKFAAKVDLPVEDLETVGCSLDGAYVWAQGRDGVAVYSVAQDSWKSFVGDDWSNYEHIFRITSDGKHLICSHKEGIAFVNIDGSGFVDLSPGVSHKHSYVTYLEPIPGTADFVCVQFHPHACGLYYVDTNRRSMRKLKGMRDQKVTAMAIAPDGFLWVSTPGQVICLDPQTGIERSGIAALRIGEPETAILKQTGNTKSSRIVVAPRSSPQGRVLAAPEPMPSRPPASSLQNKGWVWPSSHIPNMATSQSGRGYVTWLPLPSQNTPVTGGLPQITDQLPKAGSPLHHTGISVYDGQQWQKPQYLRCDVSFAWCQQEDLHLLVATSEDELHHLSYRPSTQAWTKHDVLNHGGTKYFVQHDAVHLAWFDHDRRRICYRRYNGKEWLAPAWFDAHDGFEGLAVAAGRDGIGHVVWRDGGKSVAHAWVADDKAECIRQEFTERAIAERNYALAEFPDGSLVMAYRADLYDDHPERNHAHLRTWGGQAWSDATVVPFNHFESPIFVRHADKLLLSWVADDPKVRVFSVLGSDGAWSYPLPLCSGQNDRLRCDYFVSLHADPHGRVHAVWGINNETFTVVVTDLGK